MSISKSSSGVALAALLLMAQSHASGPITFSADTPAVQPAPVDNATGAGGQTSRVAASQRVEQMPGMNRAILAPVTPEEADRATASRPVPKQLNPGLDAVAPKSKTGQTTTTTTTQRVAGDAAATAPGSIPELARALRNDPDLIYEYVRNNIAYVPTWGVQKGAVGTVLDNQGTAFDQATLMVELLRQSGYTASFVKGRISLTAAQVSDWLGVDTANVCAVLNLFGNAQIPVTGVLASAAGSCPGSTAALVSMKMDHVWVKVNIGGTNYVFDPSFKTHTKKVGINLTTATGYNASTYLTSALSGATVNADFVQNINDHGQELAVRRPPGQHRGHGGCHGSEHGDLQLWSVWRAEHTGGPTIQVHRAAAHQRAGSVLLQGAVLFASAGALQHGGSLGHSHQGGGPPG